MVEPEYRTVSVVETRHRTLYDRSITEVDTKASFDDLTGLQFEAGTTGKKGGDWGHGSRVYLRLEAGEGGFSRTPWEVTKDGEKLEIILGGDWEIEAVKKALRFMLQTLEEQTKE